MFYNANLYKVGLMNSQRHGGQRSTSVTFSTPEIPGAGLIISSERESERCIQGCKRKLPDMNYVTFFTYITDVIL